MTNITINAIITGSTGMVGKAVLLECLESKNVKSVLLINRKPIDTKHEKITEIIHQDFTNLSPIKESIKGFNACFHCMGVSSIGLNEDTFSKLTFDITKEFVDTLHELNNEMIFNYVSGTGTDSSEQGSTMWANIKGKTENYILNKGFKDAYMFRPGGIVPEKGIKSSTSWYNILYVIFRPLFPLMRKMNSMTTSTRLGQAMINTILLPQALKHLENKDINELAKK